MTHKIIPRKGHWPVPSPGLFLDAWQAMEKILAADGARAIGVSNFLPEHLDILLAEMSIVPAVNQIGPLTSGRNPVRQGADST